MDNYENQKQLLAGGPHLEVIKRRLLFLRERLQAVEAGRRFNKNEIEALEWALGQLAVMHPGLCRVHGISFDEAPTEKAKIFAAGRDCR